MSSSSVAEFYANRSVFITGFTGFLGKVVVEKLLRSCPDVNNIYVLVRSLKDKDAYQRTAKIVESTLFDQVRKISPKHLSKIVPISGDIMLDNLGISNEDKATITNNVTVVFHCAATIKFDEDLRFATQMNVAGVQRLLKLCHEMKNFAVLVHTSTAYANCELKKIAEKIYPAPMRPQKLIAALEWMDDDMVRTLSHQIMDKYGKPNTYTLTKALAEQLILEESTHLPITIVRPSIIGGTWQEPSPGWIDNLNGASGLMTAEYKGILRVVPLKDDGVADLIPVDTVSNMLIIAGWQRANMTGNALPILHCTSGQLNPVTWGEYNVLFTDACRKYPLVSALRYPKVAGTMSPWYYKINHALNHVLPAHCLDLMTRLTGGKPILVKVVNRLEYAMDTIKHFIINEWYFASQNLVNLHESMSDEDKKKFNIDIREMNWQSYIENYALGIRKHVLKEELSNLPLARRKLYRYKLFTNAVKTALVTFVLRLLIKKTQTFGKLWQYLMSIFIRIFRLLPIVRRAIVN
jgi:fatty acyl-CoA reductase